MNWHINKYKVQCKQKAGDTYDWIKRKYKKRIRKIRNNDK